MQIYAKVFKQKHKKVSQQIENYQKKLGKKQLYNGEKKTKGVLRQKRKGTRNDPGLYQDITRKEKREILRKLLGGIRKVTGKYHEIR